MQFAFPLNVGPKSLPMSLCSGGWGAGGGRFRFENNKVLLAIRIYRARDNPPSMDSRQSGQWQSLDGPLFSRRGLFLYSLKGSDREDTGLKHVLREDITTDLTVTLFNTIIPANS